MTLAYDLQTARSVRSARVSASDESQRGRRVCGLPESVLGALGWHGGAVHMRLAIGTHEQPVIDASTCVGLWRVCVCRVLRGTCCSDCKDGVPPAAVALGSSGSCICPSTVLRTMHFNEQGFITDWCGPVRRSQLSALSWRMLSVPQRG